MLSHIQRILALLLMNQPSRGGCSAGVGRETYWLRPTKPTAKLALQIVASDTRQHDSSTYVFNMRSTSSHTCEASGWLVNNKDHHKKDFSPSVCPLMHCKLHMLRQMGHHGSIFADALQLIQQAGWTNIAADAGQLYLG